MIRSQSMIQYSFRSLCITGHGDVLDNLEQDRDDQGNEIDTLQITLQGKSLSKLQIPMYMTHC